MQPASSIFLAFNKEIEETLKMRNLPAKTFHAIGYRAWSAMLFRLSLRFLPPRLACGTRSQRHAARYQQAVVLWAVSRFFSVCQCMKY